MLNQLLKVTLFASIWLWLKPRWRGLAVLLVFVVLVNLLHAEYLGYVELSENKDFLIWSYLLKWLLLFAAVIAYIVLPVRGNSGNSSAATSPRQTRPPSTGGATSEDDGFDFLRNKKELQSRADKLLERE